MKGFLRHLFLPHSSNNHRAKLLHHRSLFTCILILVLSSFLLFDFKVNYPQVLGVANNIVQDQLLLLTNQKREENGAAPLTLNAQLSQAAAAKAQNMFQQDYWAHNSPDGKTPWVFIRNAGYSYVYAGENLARGFSNSGDVVSAWMASPDHKKNLLSSNYTDVGFAVVEGKLSGEDTVLVVQMFGSAAVAQAPQQPTPKEEVAPAASVSSSKEITENSPKPLALNTTKEVAVQQPRVDSVSTSLTIARVIVGLFILVLILDMIVVERRKVVRLVGHNLDHILFLAFIFLIIMLLARGVIV